MRQSQIVDVGSPTRTRTLHDYDSTFHSSNTGEEFVLASVSLDDRSSDNASAITSPALDRSRRPVRPVR